MGTKQTSLEQLVSLADGIQQNLALLQSLLENRDNSG